MDMFTINEIRSWPVVDGWHQSPEGVRIFLGEGMLIGEDAEILSGVWLGDHVWIGPRVRVGTNSVIRPGAVIRNRAEIGANTAVGAGAVIPRGLTYIVGSQHIVYLYHPARREIGIGCEIHPIDEWLTEGTEIARRRGYSDAEIEEYSRYLRLFAAHYGWV